MTYEQAMAKAEAAAEGGESVEIRRDHLHPGGWATRNAAGLRAARCRYEDGERGRFMRQTYETNARYILRVRRRLAEMPTRVNRLRQTAMEDGVPEALVGPERPPADTEKLARQHQQTLRSLNKYRAFLQSQKGRRMNARLNARRRTQQSSAPNFSDLVGAALTHALGRELST